MNSSEIEFSAQFGGRDAADAVLRHFWALKAAACGVRLVGFPFPILAFILRVDGEVTRYGLAESGNLDVGKNGRYVSVDIEITCEDRDRLPDVIASAILSSNEHIRPVAASKSWDVDFQAFQSCMVDLVTRYKDEITREREHDQPRPPP